MSSNSNPNSGNSGSSVGGANTSLNSLPQYKPRIIKFILLGESGVGKTSLLYRFCDNRFMGNLTTSTIGVDFKWRDVSVVNTEVDGNPSETVRIHVWDTAGQEQFHVVSKPYYRQADGVLLVYDVTSAGSLQRLEQYLDDARDLCPLGVIMVLIGNKSDSPSSQIEVTKQQGEQFARKKGIPLFFETSAQSGDRVDEAFTVLAQHVVTTQSSNALLASSRPCTFCQRATAETMCLVCHQCFCMECQLVPHDGRDRIALVHRDYREIGKKQQQQQQQNNQAGAANQGGANSSPFKLAAKGKTKGNDNGGKTGLGRCCSKN